MTATFKHSGARFQKTVHASAADVWELLTDWAGILRWWPKNNPPMQILDVTLVGEHGKLPRTRRIVTAGDMVSQETLLKQDDKVRRIYYDMIDDGIPGIRNYLATTTVDDLGDGKCAMTFSSTFDVPAEADEAQLRGIIEIVYTTIANGYDAYFTGGQSK